MYITSDSDFTKLLALLKIFKLNINSLAMGYNHSELIKIVGKYWVLAPLFNNNIIFEADKNKINILFYKGTTYGVGDWHQCNPIYNCCNDNQIIDFDLSHWNTQSTVASLIFSQFNNIVDYLNREFII